MTNMRTTLVLSLALFASVLSAPQLQLSRPSYHALKKVLDGRTPIGIQSAQPVLKQLNVKPREFVVLDFNGRGYNTRPAKSPHHFENYDSPHHNHISSSPTFHSGAVRAVGGPAPSPRYHNNPSHQSHSSYTSSFGSQGSFGRKPSYGPPKSYGTPKSSFGVNPTKTAIYRNEVDNIEPISLRDSVKKITSRRQKRQTEPVAAVDDEYDYDYEEENTDTQYLETLPFALSSGGSLFGSALGRYLDTTNQATNRLLRSLTTLGTLGVSQLDNFLDQQEDKQKTASTTATK